MSREILFRGHSEDLDSLFFVEGFLIQVEGLSAIIPTEEWGYLEVLTENDEKHINIRGFYHVDPKTIGQYTGEDDKNGTKIFEGDIVERIYKYEVKFKDGGFYLHNLDGYHLRIQDLKNDFKVIENIYENV